ncbi:hypothetical protein Q0812_00940 [Brevundimonas sp. 2R-24]|uniref:Uncharacterized protein n=1 Tax=Peiella sedimenti TaxID=3061083 RepID=A0ABT8SHQ8_9CAUL|nr:hypothetical protein [Caulobacteraceae bacterium XZ-24]
MCGEINGKNRNGAYVGFTRFLADPDGTEALLEPLVLSSEEERDRAAERCRRHEGERFYSEVQRDLAVMDCERARDLAEEYVQLAEFDLTYAALCEVDEANDRADGQAESGSTSESRS